MADPFTREIALLVDEMKSSKQRSKMLADFAREEIAKTKLANEQAIQRPINKPKINVDGRQGAALGSVKPDGVIVAEFNAESDAVRWILRELERTSPELTGAYERSHVVYADGVEADPAELLPNAREFVIASNTLYARKLDKLGDLPARSKTAPNGVYQVVAVLAARRFEHEAEIVYTFRDAPAGKGKTMRQPAIVVRQF